MFGAVRKLCHLMDFVVKVFAVTPTTGRADSMSSKILFPTFNVSLSQAVSIVKTKMNDDSIPFKTRRLAIEQVAYMERLSSVTKDELAKALCWLLDHYDFDKDGLVEVLRWLFNHYDLDEDI